MGEVSEQGQAGGHLGTLPKPLCLYSFSIPRKKTSLCLALALLSPEMGIERPGLSGLLRT